MTALPLRQQFLLNGSGKDTASLQSFPVEMLILHSKTKW